MTDEKPPRKPEPAGYRRRTARAWMNDNRHWREPYLGARKARLIVVAQARVILDHAVERAAVGRSLDADDPALPALLSDRLDAEVDRLGRRERPPRAPWEPPDLWGRDVSLFDLAEAAVAAATLAPLSDAVALVWQLPRLFPMAENRRIAPFARPMALAYAAFFRPPLAPPLKPPEAARELAVAIYAERAWNRYPILADALEEVGDSGATRTVLHELRRPDPGICLPGYWLLDELAGRP